MIDDESSDAPGDTMMLEQASTTAKPAKLVKVTSLLKIMMRNVTVKGDQF